MDDHSGSPTILEPGEPAGGPVAPPVPPPSRSFLRWLVGAGAVGLTIVLAVLLVGSFGGRVQDDSPPALVVPESGLQPQRLLNGGPFVTGIAAVDDGFIAIDGFPAPEPIVLFSPNGVDWDEVVVTINFDDATDRGDIFWLVLESSESGLVLVGDVNPSDERVVLTSRDGVEWNQHATFELDDTMDLLLVDEDGFYADTEPQEVVGFYTELLSAHTSIELPPGGVCGFESSDVATEFDVRSCAGPTLDQRVTSETIASALSAERVLACVAAFDGSAIGQQPGFLRGGFGTDERTMLDVALWQDPVRLGDGGVALGDRGVVWPGNASDCNGVVDLPAQRAPAVVMTNGGGTEIGRWEMVGPSTAPREVNFRGIIGETRLVDDETHLITLWDEGIRLLNLETGEWTDSIHSSTQLTTTTAPRIGAIESGRRLYFYTRDMLNVIEIGLDEEGQPAAALTGAPLSSGATFLISIADVAFASDDLVIAERNFTAWSLPLAREAE